MSMEQKEMSLSPERKHLGLRTSKNDQFTAFMDADPVLRGRSQVTDRRSLHSENLYTISGADRRPSWLSQAMTFIRVC